MAGNKTIKKVDFKKERLQEALALHGHTIKELGESNEVEWSERSLTRFVKERSMPFEALDQIGKYIDVDPEFIMGKFDPSESMPEQVRQAMQRFIRPEKYPYARKEMREVTAYQYYASLLNVHNVSMDQFISLEPEVRFKFQHAIEDAIMPVIDKYFKDNVIGDDSSFLAMPFDSQIDSIEENYDMFGVDYWTEPDYARKISEKEAELLVNWEL